MLVTVYFTIEGDDRSRYLTFSPHDMRSGKNPPKSHSQSDLETWAKLVLKRRDRYKGIVSTFVSLDKGHTV